MTNLGLDIGGTSVKAALLRNREPIFTGRSRPYCGPGIDQLAAAIHESLAGATPDAIESVGLCVPGAWDEATGTVAVSANLPAIVGRRLDRWVADILAVDVPVRITSDAHAAAFDYWSNHGLKGRLLALSLGAGVGGCVLDNGAQLVVSGRSSGHIGQVDTTIFEPGREAPVGPDGGRGSLEAYIGAAALEVRFGAGFASRVGTLKRSDAPLQALARSIRIGHAIYRPDHIRLLGGIGLALAPAISELRSAAADSLTSVARPDWTLACGNTVFHAALGAARLAMNTMNT